MISETARAEQRVRADLNEPYGKRTEPEGLVSVALVCISDAKVILSELDAARARAEALEDRHRQLDSSYMTAQANWDLTLDRAELAESKLAEAVKALEATKDGIRELRLADGACARNADGADQRWDHALHAACELEGLAASTLASIKTEGKAS